MLKSGAAVVLLLAAVSQGSFVLREYTAVSVAVCRACGRVNRAPVTTCKLTHNFAIADFNISGRY